ncbi:MAG: prolyl oligopeptidase family serine peptidase [Gemmatimonadota bacterium]
MVDDPGRLVSLALVMALTARPAAGQARFSVETDVIYGHKAGMALTMDAYLPEAPTGAAVIFINNGGFRSPAFRFLVPDSDEPVLDERSRDHGPQPYMEQGIAFFDVRHGSAPWFDLADIATDLRAAVAYIKTQGPGLGIDPDRLGLVGSSSGAVMALYLSGKAALEGDAEHQVAAVVAYHGVDDYAAFIEVFPQIVELIPSLAEDGPGAAANFSPGRYVSNRSPPTLIFHGDEDEIAPFEGAVVLYDRLVDAGAEARFISFRGAGHLLQGEDAARASAETTAWFVRHLVGRPPA